MRLAQPIAAAAALLAAGVVARDRAPAVVPVGPAVSCIPLSQIRETRVHDDRTIDFISNAGRAARGWRVVLPQGCPELGFERRFAYETSLSQLCANDIITVFHTTPPMRGASCGLAPFQPAQFPSPR